MPHAISRSLVVAAALSLVVLLGAGGQALAAKSTKKANASSTLRSLVSQTQKLPSAAASATTKRRLVRAARHARSVAAKSPCTAVKDLKSYRKVLKSARIRSSARGSKNRARLRQKLAALAPASLPVARGDQGTWSVSSSYAGNEQFAASQSAACSILVAVSTPTE